MLRSFEVLAGLVALILAGTASAHLVLGDPVHLDIEFGVYIAGEPLAVRIFVSNPTGEDASFGWTSSCMLFGSMESERRVLAFWNPQGPCLYYIPPGLDVPANSSVLWRDWAIDTLPDDGCIRIDVSLAGYPVSGLAETCPGPAPPPLARMMLVISAPGAARSGEVLGFSLQALTTEGRAIEGIRIDARLGGEELPAAHTGPDGRLSITAPAPEVESTTPNTLIVRASGEGWRNASATRTILIFPQDRRYLVLESRFATGDLVRTGESAILEVTVRGNDGRTVPEASLAVELTGPLALEQSIEVGDGRHRLTFRAGNVSEGRVASARIVANAPDWEGGETGADYAVLPPIPTTARDLPESIDLHPWGAFAALGVLSVVVVGSFAVIRNRRKTGRL